MVPRRHGRRRPPPPRTRGARLRFAGAPVQQVRTRPQQQAGQEAASSAAMASKAMTLEAQRARAAAPINSTAPPRSTSQIGNEQEHRQVGAVAIDITRPRGQSSRHGAGEGRKSMPA